MSRRHQAKQRPIEPDPVFGSVAIAKFTNYIMEGGKKALASKIVFEALSAAAQTLKVSPIEVFEKAIENVTPRLEVKSRRVGGATFQVPEEVAPRRRVKLACSWIIDAARAKKGSPINKKLAELLVLSYNNEGPAVKKKDDTHRMAEANKAFAHFKF